MRLRSQYRFVTTVSPEFALKKILTYIEDTSSYIFSQFKLIHNMHGKTAVDSWNNI